MEALPAQYYHTLTRVSIELELIGHSERPVLPGLSHDPHASLSFSESVDIGQWPGPHDLRASVPRHLPNRVDAWMPRLTRRKQNHLVTTIVLNERIPAPARRHN